MKHFIFSDDTLTDQVHEVTHELQEASIDAESIETRVLHAKALLLIEKLSEIITRT